MENYYDVVRTADEIDDEVDAALNQLEENGGRSKWPSMTYEQGVRNALGWVLGEIDERPITDNK